MALNDLLQNRFTRIIGTLAALALPAGLACEADEGSPVYPSSSQSTSQPCYSDSECKGERICVNGYCQDSNGEYGLPGENNSNGSNDSNGDIYGYWKKLKETDATGTKVYDSTSAFPLVIFAKCNNGFDQWIEYEGLTGNNSCNYSDGGLFTYGSDWLTTTITTDCMKKEPPFINVETSHIDLYEMVISSETLTLTDDSGYGLAEIVFKRYTGNTDFCPDVCSQGMLYFDENHPSKQYPCE